MTQKFRAIYQNGVFRPLQPIDLPEGSIVWITITEISDDDPDYIKYVEKNSSESDESKDG